MINGLKHSHNYYMGDCIQHSTTWWPNVKFKEVSLMFNCIYRLTSTLLGGLNGFFTPFCCKAYKSIKSFYVSIWGVHYHDFWCFSKYFSHFSWSVFSKLLQTFSLLWSETLNQNCGMFFINFYYPNLQAYLAYI